MRWLTEKMDRLVRKLCEWLNARFPGQHGLVHVGYRLAGLGPELLLPIDRRLGPHIAHMTYNNHTEKMKKALAKGGNANESDCGFWAYCYISGQPCHRCRPGGVPWINSLLPGRDKDLTALCKKMGKESGTMWFGCCKDPKGNVRIIGFGDCCSPGFPAAQDCATKSPWCHGWPDAKNWCYLSGSDESARKKTYYCTISIDVGECTT